MECAVCSSISKCCLNWTAWTSQILGLAPFTMVLSKTQSCDHGYIFLDLQLGVHFRKCNCLLKAELDFCQLAIFPV